MLKFYNPLRSKALPICFFISLYEIKCVGVYKENWKNFFVFKVSHIEAVSQDEARDFVEDDTTHSWKENIHVSSHHHMFNKMVQILRKDIFVSVSMQMESLEIYCKWWKVAFEFYLEDNTPSNYWKVQNSSYFE